jgi:hypothetical protein
VKNGTIDRTNAYLPPLFVTILIPITSEWSLNISNCFAVFKHILQAFSAVLYVK